MGLNKKDQDELVDAVIEDERSYYADLAREALVIMRESRSAFAAEGNSDLAARAFDASLVPGIVAQLALRDVIEGLPEALLDVTVGKAKKKAFSLLDPPSPN